MAGRGMTGWARAAAMGAALMLGAATGGSARTDQDTYESLRAEAFEAAQWAIASDAADALAKVSARFAQGDDAIGRLAEERETLIIRRDRSMTPCWSGFAPWTRKSSSASRPTPT